jgi:hypothetical protein
VRFLKGMCKRMVRHPLVTPTRHALVVRSAARAPCVH